MTTLESVFPPPPTNGYWIYRGGHHSALMWGRKTIGHIHLSPVMVSNPVIAEVQRDLEAIARKLNKAVDPVTLKPDAPMKPNKGH